MHNLQSDINEISNFCKNNSLLINVNKTEHLRIQSRKELPETFLPFKYQCQDCDITSVKLHKHLGVIFDNKLNFDDHTNYLVKKASKKLYYLKLSLRLVSWQVFLKAYVSYILPILEYNSSSWYPNKKQSELLERVQKDATNYICYKKGCQKLNYKARLEELSILSLEKRRELKLVNIGFNIVNDGNVTPVDWKNQLQICYNNRTGPRLNYSVVNYSRTKKYPVYLAADLFNALNIDIRKETNQKLFRDKVIAFYNTL